MQNPPVSYGSRSRRHTDGVSDPRYPQYGPPPGYPAPYGSGYGAPMPWPPATERWPYGPRRPSLATAAAVLGHVTAGLTCVFSLMFLLVLLSGKGDPTIGVLVLGLPCSAGLVVGGLQLMRRRSASLLFASAAVSVTVLLVSLIVGVGWLVERELIGLALFVVLALPLPLLTAIFARAGSVTSWLAAGRR
jgi:hypothetical protein